MDIRDLTGPCGRRYDRCLLLGSYISGLCRGRGCVLLCSTLVLFLENTVVKCLITGQIMCRSINWSIDWLFIDPTYFRLIHSSLNILNLVDVCEICL